MDIDMDSMENENINDDTAPLLPRETSFIDEVSGILINNFYN